MCDRLTNEIEDRCPISAVVLWAKRWTIQEGKTPLSECHQCATLVLLRPRAAIKIKQLFSISR